MENIKVLIATHRDFKAPSDLQLYLPVHVGSSGKADLGYQRDDEGDNISLKNPNYCELTGIYWAWKNLNASYVGLVHYRRYFSNKPMRYSKNLLVDDVAISRHDILVALQKCDVIVPKKRKYYIETLYSHYANTFDASHLDQTRDILKSLYPEQLAVYDLTMKQTSGYMFNMFIMKKDLLNNYCEWLFPILDELYTRIDTSNMTAFEARYIGRVSELLFNVWLNVNHFVVCEKSVVHFGNINFLKKASAFLNAKFFKKKYKQSF